MQTDRSRMITWHLRKRARYNSRSLSMGKRGNLRSFVSLVFAQTARACFKTWFIHITFIGSLICERNRGASHQKVAQLVCRHITNHLTQHVLSCHHESSQFPWTKHWSCLHSGMPKNRVTGIDFLKLFVTYNVSLWTQYSHRFFTFRDPSNYFRIHKILAA